MGNDYYSQKADAVLKGLNSSKKGLTTNEAKKRLETYGYNEIKKVRRITAIGIFISQFKNALIILLVFAAILSLILG